MARITLHEEEIDVNDDTPLQEPCMELGIPFGCQSGVCGTCIIEVLEGGENLTERTEAEKDMQLEDNERLSCQCKIKHGSVKIDF